MYERTRLHGHFKSLDGNKYAQIFATEDYFTAAYPMENKALVGDSQKKSSSQTTVFPTRS